MRLSMPLHVTIQGAAGGTKQLLNGGTGGRGGYAIGSGGGAASPRTSVTHNGSTRGGVQIVLPIFCKWFERDFLDDVATAAATAASLFNGGVGGGGGGGMNPHSHQSALAASGGASGGGGGTATATATSSTTRTSSFSAAMSSTHNKPMRPIVRAMLEILAQYCTEEQVRIQQTQHT